jgi:hypothetical protein
MEIWRKAWRDGFAGQFSDQALYALRRALQTDDPRLIQGGTTSPPPLESQMHEPVGAACLVAFAGWQGNACGAGTVAEVEEFFARACFEADDRLGGPAECRHFLNWFDDTDRAEVLGLLAAEVDRELGRRFAAAA